MEATEESDMISPAQSQAQSQAPSQTPSRHNSCDDRASSVASSMVGAQASDLLVSSEVLDAIFHHIPMGVILITCWGILRGLSKGAERMFMLSASDVNGDNVSSLMPASVACRHDYYLSRARQKMVTRMSVLLRRPEATIALDDIDIDDPAQSERIGNDILRTELFAGQRREVTGVDRTGTHFPIELQISPVIVRNMMHFIGYALDVRDLILFQNLTVQQELLLRSTLNTRTTSRLLAGERTLNDVFPTATIAYIRIADYSTKVHTLDNDEAAAILVQLVFAFIDRVVQQTRLEKIKSVGHIYILACGVPTSTHGDQHAEAMVAAMYAVLCELYRFNRSHRSGAKKSHRQKATAGQQTQATASLQQAQELIDSVCPIQLRIGIHSGSCVGGWFSATNGVYDVYGNAVIQAEELAREGNPDRLHLSGQTFNQLPPYIASKCTAREDKGLPYSYELQFTTEDALMPPEMMEANAAAAGEGTSGGGGGSGDL